MTSSSSEKMFGCDDPDCISCDVLLPPDHSKSTKRLRRTRDGIAAIVKRAEAGEKAERLLFSLQALQRWEGNADLADAEAGLGWCLPWCPDVILERLGYVRGEHGAWTQKLEPKS